jgi:hypothetical protein
MQVQPLLVLNWISNITKNKPRLLLMTNQETRLRVWQLKLILRSRNLKPPELSQKRKPPDKKNLTRTIKNSWQLLRKSPLPRMPPMRLSMVSMMPKKNSTTKWRKDGPLSMNNTNKLIL